MNIFWELPSLDIYLEFTNFQLLMKYSFKKSLNVVQKNILQVLLGHERDKFVTCICNLRRCELRLKANCEIKLPYLDAARYSPRKRIVIKIFVEEISCSFQPEELQLEWSYGCYVFIIFRKMLYVKEFGNFSLLYKITEKSLDLETYLLNLKTS